MPPARRRRVSDQVLGGIALLLVGAFAAFGIQSLAQPSAPSATSAASVAPTDDTGALPTGDTGAGASDTPSGTAPAVSPILEAAMPKTVEGTTLSVQSVVDATNLSSDPDGRALNAAIADLGKQASNLEIAYASDQTSSLDLTILGFRADGVGAAAMRTLILDTWLAAGTPGVTSSSVTLSGRDATKVSYGDGGADEYVIVVGDSVFVIETSDATVAKDTVAAFAGGTASPSSTPSAS